MLTTIQFIGLIVTTLLGGTPTPGAQLIMGNFPATLPPHIRIIAYPPLSRVNPNNEWPKVGNFVTADGKAYDFVQVTLENITITGPTEPFDNQLGGMPHLTCCCPAFNAGFKPDWGDPNVAPAQKKSAFFTFNNGTYTTVIQPSGAATTALLLSDNVNITFTGTLSGSATKTLVLKPGNDFIVANEPRCVLEGKKCPSMTNKDFLNYYLMGNGTQGCQAQPPTSPCVFGTTSCPSIPKSPAGATTTTTTTAGAARAKKPKLTAQQQRAVAGKYFSVDAVCSSSQWP